MLTPVLLCSYASTVYRLVLLFSLVSLLPLGARAQTGPANVLLARGRTEPIVAVDPRHPKVIVAGSNTNYNAPVNGTDPVGSFSSSDGGRTFRFLNVPLRAPYTTGADPTVAIARDGTVFYDYLGESPAYCSGGRSAVILAHSIDHGASYRPPVVVDSNAADDKPSMTVENVPDEPSHLFVVWTRWHKAGSDIWFARSLDGGASFTRAHMLYTTSLNSFSPEPVVGPNGHIYVFWSIFPQKPYGSLLPTRIVMRASTNDGRTFGPLRTIVSFDSIPLMAQPGSLRELPGPAVTADPGGALYLAWPQATTRHGNEVYADIRLTRSGDGGKTWSKAVRVNNVRRGDRFMPALTSWSTGNVGIAFYDRRDSPNQLSVYAAAVSYDGRLHVSANVRVNRGTSPISDIYYLAPGSTCFSPGRFFGDYIGVAPCAGNTLGVVWADTQLHVADETDIWFARVAFSPDTRRLSKARTYSHHVRRPLDLALSLFWFTGPA